LKLLFKSRNYAHKDLSFLNLDFTWLDCCFFLLQNSITKSFPWVETFVQNPKLVNFKPWNFLGSCTGSAFASSSLGGFDPTDLLVRSA
jgi:hypothetical protein